VSPSLEELLEQIPVLAGQPREVTELPGGLTNRNYRVRTGRLDVVVRVSDPSSGLLAIDRMAEHANAVRAAETGIGAAVVDYLPGRGVLVVEYVESTTWTDADVAAKLPAAAGAVRTLHGGEAFVNRFDFFAIHRGYLQIMRDKGFRMPEGYLDDLPTATRVESALAVAPEPLVPCHNDLLAANFLEQADGRVRIIDYEYSGMNESSFELGNLVQEARLDREALAELVSAYDGRTDPVRVARAELWSVMSAFGWTLWGTIQAGASDLDFDFYEWGLEKYERARAAFSDRRFGELLDVVGGRR
jgi:thiamine kinase-like enzyme